MSTSLHIPGQKSGPGGTVLNVLSYLALGIMTVLFLLPFYLLVRNALSTQQDLSSFNWTIFPSHPQWHNFVELFTSSDIPMARSLLNSTIIAVGTTLGTLLFCSMAAYALARIQHPLNNLIFYLILATLMIPTAVTFVPSFIIVSALGWISDYRGLIIPTIFSAFAVFLFRQSFLDFPKELEEAGRVDGLSHWGVFWRIVVPNSGSIFVALAVITFIANWNAFLWPLIIAQDQNMWTVQVTMATFLTAQTVNIPLLFAAAVVAVIPLVIIFVVLQRFLVQGVASSGLKG